MKSEKTFIPYYRVSTRSQGDSGLGLDAQKSTVENYLKNNNGVVLNSYTEIESGKSSDNRPELIKALNQCLETDSTLLISKLDRLSRDVEFIAKLMKTKVKFVAIDLPDANEFTIHIFASLAQQERKYISTRTKEALKSLKEKGIKLGAPNATFTDDMRLKSAQVLNSKRLNNENNIRAKSVINLMKDKTLQEIATYLNDNGFISSRGGKFYPSTIKNLLK